MEKRRLIVIGGRWSPEPWVIMAKELGCWVMATHYDPRLGDVVGADETRFIDPRNLTGMKQLFIENGIDALVYDGDDGALIAAGILSGRFGLPGPRLDSVIISTNKERLRIVCGDYHIPQPRFCIGSRLEELYVGVDLIGGLPAVVKPIDNQWGAGINKVEKKEELHEAFFEAISNSPSKRFIIEKFIEGMVLIVEGICLAPGFCVPFAIGSKNIQDQKRLLTSELIFPAECSNRAQEAAFELYKTLGKVLGYDFGFMHTEFIVDGNQNLWLLEATNRGSAYAISPLITSALIEIPLAKYVIEMALGENMPLKIYGELQTKRTALFSTFRFEHGRIKKIRGLSEARLFPGVLAYDIFYREGDLISLHHQRDGYMALCAGTKEELKIIKKKIRELVTIEYY